LIVAVAVDRERHALLYDVSQLVNYRELLLNLAARDLKIRYKQSLLGIAWAVLQPFALMVVFSVIFSLFVKVKTPGIPYPVFSYVALVPWTYFANALTLGVSSLVGNANLVGKIYFPREVLPLASLVGCFADFLVAATIFAGMLLYYHIGLTLQVLWLPGIIVLQMAFMFGVMLILSAANVFYRDIRLLLPFLLQLWMYVTPVIYPLSVIPPRFRWLFSLNPMTGVIDGYRRVIVQGQAPDFHLLSFTALSAVVLLGIGYRFFKGVEMQLADVI
jgi:lipopolysaccharide transport system permease protein